MQKPVRVLIVDDSQLIRSLFTDMLESSPDIEVVGTAEDPHIARAKIKELNPDVITLDIEMPHMDGLTFLEKIMTLRPMPVLMCSTLTQKGAEATMRALELGAVDYIPKPSNHDAGQIEQLKFELISKVRIAASARVKPLAQRPAVAQIAAPVHTKSNAQIIAIGASTGGVEAIRMLLAPLPTNLPPIVITQHMPPLFTRSFAQRLDSLSSITVMEAEDGMRLQKGHAYIAPGHAHMRISKNMSGLHVVLGDDGPISSHRPSVDALFSSVAQSGGAKAIGILLTGMGKDGAQGLLAMRNAGAVTFGESESSCVVYGMPKVAYDLGAVMTQLPLQAMPQKLVQACFTPSSSQGAVYAR